MRFEAAILDLDGVLTRTEQLHARAWKALFDAYLRERSEREGEKHTPFTIEEDYARYVDGKLRYDGVRSFLASRGIELPEGTPDDAPEEETVCGLGNRKNERFHALLQQQGVEVYSDAVEQLRRWRAEGLKTALITSSRNGAAVLEAAGLTDLFDVQVDGLDSQRLGLEGKPAPDIFLEAAEQLGVAPGRALVVEDAQAGCEAARRGGFGLVVGVQRDGGGAEALRARGADLVVRDLRAIPDAVAAREETQQSPPPRPALVHLDEIVQRLAGRRLALFLDYDGTLTPIVRRPEEATLSEPMRVLLKALARHVPLAIVSGRDLADVQAMVGLDNLYYAGSHGFDIAGPDGVRMQHEEATESLPDLDAAERKLEDRLRKVEGARVERKRFAIAIHYREVAGEVVPRVEAAVDEVLEKRERLRKKGGKKIFELQPDVPWDKGRAVRWLLDVLDVDDSAVVPVYIGDDVTDEDAYEALKGEGLGIRVGALEEPTHAEYLLRDTDEVRQLFQALLERIDSKHYG